MRSFFERSRARQVAEVKAILHRLQALSVESAAEARAVTRARGRYRGRRALAAGLGLIGGLVTIGLGAFVLHGLGGPTSSPQGQRATQGAEDFTLPTLIVRQPTEKLEQSAQSIFEKALQDMAAGSVRAAREALIRIQHQG